MLNVRSFLAQMTTRPGVYQMLGKNGNVLYVGKARNLKKRLASYFSSKPKDIKLRSLLQHVHDIQVTITPHENDALILECNLIKKYQPHYNVLFRDDKSYPYIVITDDYPYPAIDFYRGRKKKKGNYFGPYPNVSAVRETIYVIKKIFGLRAVQDHYRPERLRPCLQYQIGLCSGACAGLISKEDYQNDVEHAVLFLQGKNEAVLIELKERMQKASLDLRYEYAAKIRDQITKLREIQARQHIEGAQSGDIDVIGLAHLGLACIQLLVIRGGRVLGSRAYFPTLPEHTTPEDILTSFITQHYLAENQSDIIPKEIILDKKLPESKWLMDTLSIHAHHKVKLSCATRGQRKKWLQIANQSAQQSVTTQLFTQANMQERFDSLKKVLGCESLKRIECFDVSHTMGEETVASCVVFNHQGPVKSSYRRFNIQNVTPGNDIGAIQQAIWRRYHRLSLEESQLPDLIFVDGGRAQVAVAVQVLNQLNLSGRMVVMGVAKGAGRKPGLEKLYFAHQQGALHLSPDSLALHFIQYIRDEAHRFAITGHRLRRDKKRQGSVLETIPGIGAQRRRQLLHYFGGIQAINRASLEELARVPGISQELAHRIYVVLHDDG